MTWKRIALMGAALAATAVLGVRLEVGSTAQAQALSGSGLTRTIVYVQNADGGFSPLTATASATCITSSTTCGTSDGGSNALPASGLVGRRWIIVQNKGTESVYVREASTVDGGWASGSGLRLFSGERERFDCTSTACNLECEGFAVAVTTFECR